MDRNELSALIRRIYIMGQEDAIKKFSEINLEQIRTEISEIKGIGETRSIMAKSLLLIERLPQGQI